jgi:hypothetical protein
MRIIHAAGRILSVVALTISIFLASCTVQSPFHPTKHFSPVSPKAGEPAASNEKFQCDHPKTQTPGDPSSKHRITLSWKASVSLSTPPADGEGYNLYRLNPDGSCTKVNRALIRGTVYEDRFVELGKIYRYAARAVKRDKESSPSNVIEVSVPRT